MIRRIDVIAGITTIVLLPVGAHADGVSRTEAVDAIRKAATYYREHVSSHGGYVYHYSLDLKRQWGEGEYTKDQIQVQPPGTPTVGMAFLAAWKATGDKYYLDAAREAAYALVYGQLKSGGWTNCIDFNPRGERVADYRNGDGRGKNNSSLDDGQTQSAIRFMVLADKAFGFQNERIHRCAQTSLDALLKAQFPNGAFPQVWTGPVSGGQPRRRAGYPDYDWRTEGRIKNYWDMYTLNDNVCGYVADTLIEAHGVYGGNKYTRALERLGNFLILAQMPDPQPGWAQQYNYDMQPIWARRFEPAGVAGDETQEAIETLMKISAATGDRKYLEPIPRALAWLRKSRLPDGRIARYYELKTNRPLYMSRSGRNYSLTYDDSRLPRHYGWKIESRIEELEAAWLKMKNGGAADDDSIDAVEIRRIINELDEQGRWITRFAGEPVVGQLKLPKDTPYLSSGVFSRNITTLSVFVRSLGLE